jgi:hypothetical protein
MSNVDVICSTHFRWENKRDKQLCSSLREEIEYLRSGNIVDVSVVIRVGSPFGVALSWIVIHPLIVVLSFVIIFGGIGLILSVAD